MGDSDLPKDAPPPRLCHLIKRVDFVGYGFNLHAERNKVGQYVGKVDEGSPAWLSGMKEHDRIVEVNGVNIGNENHKQVVERIKTNPNETQLLVVDRQTDAYYKDKKIVIKGTMSNVLYLKTPSVEEEEKMIDNLSKRVTITEPAKQKNEEEYDPNYATIATPSPPPPPEVSSPPSPDEPVPIPPTPPPEIADAVDSPPSPPIDSPHDASIQQQLEIEIPAPSNGSLDDSVTPPPPYEYAHPDDPVTPEASPVPSPNDNSLPPPLAEEVVPTKPTASPMGRHHRVDGASDPNGNDNSKVATNKSGSGVGGSSVGGGGSAVDGEPVFGLSVADMRARLQSKKRVDVRGAERNRNFKEKYDIFQKL